MKPSLAKMVAESRGILLSALATHNPAAVFALYSGGHDSTVASHLAASVLGERLTACAHVNTGIGIEETRQFVRATCARYGWKLLEYHPPPGCTYRELVLKWGFPGPAGHTLIYNRLKERCLRQLVREHKPPTCRICQRPRLNHGSPKGRKVRCDHRFAPQRVMFVTGVRKQESKRRMGHIVAEQLEEGRVWVAPLVDWDDQHKLDYMEHFEIAKNPVVLKMCMSGECGCGAYAHPGEREEIRRWYPALDAQIAALEAEAKAAGVHHVWGTRPPKGKAPKLPLETMPAHGLCFSCEAKNEEQVK